MKENLEDILKEKMSGYAEKAPDLRKSIFEKMDARMNGEEFEGAVREKLSDYSVKAPNLLERIFSTRTAWFVLRNRFILGVEKYRYAIFTLVVGALLWSSYSEYLFNNSTDHSAVAIEEKTSAGNLEEGNAKNQTQQATVRSDVQESTEQVISGSSINTDQQVVTGVCNHHMKRHRISCAIIYQK